MRNIGKFRIARTVGNGVLLGIAGGTAEIAWIALNGMLGSIDSAVVASGVSATVSTAIPGPALHAAPVVFGIIIHLLLAIGLGIALVLAWYAMTGCRPERINEYAFTTSALTVVWAFNFFVLLPVINPDFVQIVPYPVSLASKLMFGLAAAVMLRRAAVGRSALIPVRARIR
jgi:hypothetical protein